MKADGVDAAVTKYHELKANNQGEYRIEELALTGIAYKLYETGKMAESIPFWELSAAEFPDGRYPYLCHYFIGNAHRELGDKDAAIAAYRRSLELNPDYTSAADALAELEG
jgi:tetratricopeptide (TPR) repeat protein